MDMQRQGEARAHAAASPTGLVELAREDVTQRLGQGSPVVVNLQSPESAWLERHRRFYATLRNDAEREVFAEMGPPDRVDSLELAGREEVTWWYFRSGKAYRFQEGRVGEVVRFEPVASF